MGQRVSSHFNWTVPLSPGFLDAACKASCFLEYVTVRSGVVYCTKLSMDPVSLIIRSAFLRPGAGDGGAETSVHFDQAVWHYIAEGGTS